MRIYLASSWRNTYFTSVVSALREAGHDVYDFRNPTSGDGGFKWSMIDADNETWPPDVFREQLQTNPLARRQLQNDVEALASCDACVLVLPCGRSAHTEAGWMAGKGKRVLVFIPEKQEPELMYGLFDGVCCTLEELVTELE